MRKIILIAVALALIILLLFLVTGIIRKVNANTTAAKTIERLPDFSFLTLNNDTLCSSDILRGPLLVIHFHPECEHCKYEISSLLQSDILSMDCRVLLITDGLRDSVKAFVENCSIKDLPSFTTLLDTAYQFRELFGSYAYPSNYIYNRNLELVKVLKGEYKTETIIKYLADCE